MIPAPAHEYFWEAEHGHLTKRQGEFTNPLPPPAELEAHFTQWEKERMPALIAQREQRIRIAQQGQARKPVIPHGSPVLSSSSSREPQFFQQLLAKKSPGSVQSPSEIPMSYLEAFQSDLTTIADVARHESLIYQQGFTPGDIRHNIKLILRTLPFDQPMQEFRITDIPPAHRDPTTNMVLHALLSERDKIEEAATLCLEPDGPNSPQPQQSSKRNEQEHV